MVLYDRVFISQEHDHIGVILEVRDHDIIAAEGNIDNKSGVIKRPIDEHIRAYILEYLMVIDIKTHTTSGLEVRCNTHLTVGILQGTTLHFSETA